MAFAAQASCVNHEIEMPKDIKNGGEEVRLKGERLKREKGEEEEAETIEENRMTQKMRRKERCKAQREELTRDQEGLKAAAEESMRLKRQASVQLVGVDKKVKMGEGKNE